MRDVYHIIDARPSTILSQSRTAPTAYPFAGHSINIRSDRSPIKNFDLKHLQNRIYSHDKECIAPEERIYIVRVFQLSSRCILYIYLCLFRCKYARSYNNGKPKYIFEFKWMVSKVEAGPMCATKCTSCEFLCLYSFILS